MILDGYLELNILTKTILFALQSHTMYVRVSEARNLSQSA